MERSLFIRYSPSFGLNGFEAFKKFKEWEVASGLPNLEYNYDKDGALVIKEIGTEEAARRFGVNPPRTK